MSLGAAAVENSRPSRSNSNGSMDQSSRRASTTSRWPIRRMGFFAPVPRSRATILPLRSFGPSTCTSLAANPALRRRLAIAFAATRGAAHRIGRVDFNELLENVPRELLGGVIQLRVQRPCKEKLAVTASANRRPNIFNPFSPRKGTTKPKQTGVPAVKMAAERRACLSQIRDRQWRSGTAPAW